MSRSGVTSRSALPHSGTSRLGGHSRLRKPTSTSIRAISNFGTSKSRTCARLGCLRIERWAREGIARANVAFPPIATSTVAIANGSFTSRAAGRQQRRNLRSGSKAGPWSDTASHGGRSNAKAFSPAPPQAQGHCRRHREYQILRQAGERLDQGPPGAEEAARGIGRMIAATMAFLPTRPRQRVMSVAISPTSGAPTSIVLAPRG